MLRDGSPVIVKRQVILTGDSLTDAQPGFDSQTQQPKVDLTVDAKGGRIMRDVSRENLRKRMAIILFEKGKGEALTAPVIQAELAGAVLHHVFDVGHTAHVRAVVRHLGPCGLTGGQHFGTRAIHIAKAVEHDVGTLARQGLGDAKTNAAGGAGDEGSFAFQHGSLSE